MNAKAKKYGIVAAGVLLTLLAVNTLAKRVPVVAQIKNTVDNGL